MESFCARWAQLTDRTVPLDIAAAVKSALSAPDPLDALAGLEALHRGQRNALAALAACLGAEPLPASPLVLPPYHTGAVALRRSDGGPFFLVETPGGRRVQVGVPSESIKSYPPSQRPPKLYVLPGLRTHGVTVNLCDVEYAGGGRWWVCGSPLQVSAVQLLLRGGRL